MVLLIALILFGLALYLVYLAEIYGLRIKCRYIMRSTHLPIVERLAPYIDQSMVLIWGIESYKPWIRAEADVSGFKLALNDEAGKIELINLKPFQLQGYNSLSFDKFSRKLALNVIDRFEQLELAPKPIAPLSWPTTFMHALQKLYWQFGEEGETVSIGLVHDPQQGLLLHAKWGVKEDEWLYITIAVSYYLGHDQEKWETTVAFGDVAIKWPAGRKQVKEIYVYNTGYFMKWRKFEKQIERFIDEATVTLTDIAAALGSKSQTTTSPQQA